MPEKLTLQMNHVAALRERSVDSGASMNKFQAKGAAIYLIGRMQEILGRLLGSRMQQSKGFDRQIAGKAAIAVGDAIELLKHCQKH